ncbi:apolipoprotein N-acyltransferase [Limisphaera sp. VF-2]|uniref:apolipoprotein N-acyltransferase n=1 Tax=Limisphaera sp. VF-2 TaxID=3400418 RepID=UPI0030B38CC7
MRTDTVIRGARYGVALLAGLARALAVPTVSWAGLAWVAPALLVAAGHGAAPGQRWRLGYVAGLVQYLVSLHWLLEIPVRGYPVLGWLALSAYLALYPAAWLWWVGGFASEPGPWTSRTLRALTAAAAWVTLEMVQARLLGGFPWNLLGASQHAMIPLIQLAALTGVYGLSFLIVWVSLGLYHATRAIWTEPTRRHAWLPELALPGLALALVFAWGWLRVRHYAEDPHPLRVTVVQPSIPQTLIWDPGENSNRFAGLLQLTAEALREPADLLLWPEAAIPMPIRYDRATYEAVTELARNHRLWMIVGSDDAEPVRDDPTGRATDYFNATFLVSPEGNLRATYRKMRLVMFGEFIPLSRWLPFLRWFTPITGQYTPGRDPVVFELEQSVSGPARFAAQPGANLRTATLICFEDVFPHLTRRFARQGLDFLVNLTNDGWFGQSAAQWQHAANAVFRAVETGRPLIRCTNNGVSCWIDPLGRVRAVLRDRSGSVHGAGWAQWLVFLPDPAARQTPTFYTRYGDVWGWLCAAWTVAAVGVSMIGTRRAGPQNRRSPRLPASATA